MGNAGAGTAGAGNAGAGDARITRSTLLRTGAAVLTAGAVGLTTGCARESGSSGGARTPTSSTTTPSPTGSTGTEPPATATPTPTPTETWGPVSIPAFAEMAHTGDRFRITKRERGNGWMSYDASWRVRSTGPDAAGEPVKVTGVLTLPDGPGPHPVVVLAHGYIDPAIYRSGQGMTRERGWLGERGWASLHVDYRGHAGSDPDPSGGADVRLGYAVDVLGAIDAMRRSELAVDHDRVAVFGRSMGGGVVQKVAEIEPDAVRAVVAWAAVSSLEPENVEQFMPPGDSRRRLVFDVVGSPEEEPEFWQGVSPRPFFDRITAPVLLVHGTQDDTCPPKWARATHRAMLEAGVDAELEWYDDGHAFGPEFDAAMRDTLAFLEKHVS